MLVNGEEKAMGKDETIFSAHRAKDRERGAEVGRFEEYPRDQHAQERQQRVEGREQTIDDGKARRGDVSPPMVDHQISAVKRAPEYERPCRPVPKAAE